MKVDVVLLPAYLRPDQLDDKTVVVFDVLRATTTMTAALAAGVKEIRIFGDLDSAMAAGKTFTEPHLLVGERNAVKPPGFDLGNSPGALNREKHHDQTLLMTTTNGTKAILAAASARAILIGALVNANAVADALTQIPGDVTLLCSGTEGFPCTEDVLGAGAVISALEHRVSLHISSDIAWMARSLFCAEHHRLHEALAATRGGHNVTRAGLEPDIEFCAALNTFDIVGVVRGHPPIVTAWE